MYHTVHSILSMKANRFTVTILLLVWSLELVKAVRIYTYLLDPRENPDYTRYRVPHPTLEVFKPLPQFATLRNFPTNQSHLVNYTQLIDQYCLNANTTLGGIIWPVTEDVLFANNYKEFVQYVKEKGLYITSVHGFSPVSVGYRPPRDVLDYLEASLGDKWFGVANGEQDGHYFGSFIGEELPLSNPPIEQYLNFRDYFDKMEDTLGPKLTTLLSSVYPHYQLKTGLYTLAGAETSQHGPNAQLRYSFIRGAGKQYGVIWFGNVSIYNRFGHKVYSTKSNRSTSKRNKRTKQGNTRQFLCKRNTPTKDYTFDPLGDPFGPTCGTSLNLMKRLMYAQMMYNSGYVSIEGGWFYDNSAELSPIGLIQHNAYKWVMDKKVASFGKHLATVAVYLDYFNGWASPRQKRGVVYRTWTNLPYKPSDYLTDEIFRLLYPSYQDASYFHDESGVSSPTPYGDTADVILSDAPAWAMKEYNTIIVSSQLTGGAEVASNLLEFVKSGGNLVITAQNLAALPIGYFNVSTEGGCKAVKAGEKVYLYSQKEPITERYNMTVCQLKFPESAVMLARLQDGTPLAVALQDSNGGSVIVMATPYALSSTQTSKPDSEVDQTLTSPFPLLDHAKVIFHKVLSNASIVQTTSDLSVVTNYLDDNNFLVLVSNPELKQQPLEFLVTNGEITTVEEIALDQSEKGHVGYLPDGYEDGDIGHSTSTTIAGGDTRMFRLTTTLKMTKISKPVVKPRPRGVAVHLRKIKVSLRHEILSRPTFFQHYDSIVIDYSYLITKDEEILAKEKQWLQTQGVRVYVDATPSINLFPMLRLTSDAPDWYNESMNSLKKLLNKMHTLGSHNLILSLHVFPGDQSKEATFTQISTSLHHLQDQAKLMNIKIHILNTPKNQFELLPMSRWLDRYNLTSVTFILSLARLMDYRSSSKYDSILNTRTSMLYVNAPGWDLFGMKFTDNEPISKNETTRVEISKLLDHICSIVCCPYNTSSKIHKKLKKDVWSDFHQKRFKATECVESEVLPIVMDSLYLSQDEEYTDIHTIEQLLLPSS